MSRVKKEIKPFTDEERDEQIRQINEAFPLEEKRENEADSENINVPTTEM
ncbi:hypothetical protein [Tellurirhabdus bombi]|nr:hypothetical protein [Tellurirhabdus bombi]